MGRQARQSDRAQDRQLRVDRDPLIAAPSRGRGRTRRWATGRTDRRVERTLAALAVAALALIGAILVTVLVKAWPSFSHNGLGWFGPGGNVETQLRAMAEGK